MGLTAEPSAAALLSLRGRTIVVTGGSGGIGGAVVQLLAACGADVVSIDRHERETPASAGSTFGCDLGDAHEVQTLGATIAERWSCIHGFVHCAGITRDGVLWKLADDDWTQVMTVNLHSSFWLLRALAPSLRNAASSGADASASSAAVVLVTSINGIRGKRGQANYAASKAGLIGLARSAARDFGRSGVRVNCIAPGMVATPMTAALPDAVRRAALEESVLGRLGAPQDVAGAVLFLLSDLSRHVTGQVLHVDGGQCMA